MQSVVYIYSRVSELADKFLESILRLPSVELAEAGVGDYGPSFHARGRIRDSVYDLEFVRARPREDGVDDDDVVVYLFNKQEDLTNELKHLSTLDCGVQLVNVVSGDSYTVGNYHAVDIAKTDCGKVVLDYSFGAFDNVKLNPTLNAVINTEFNAESETLTPPFYLIKAEKLRAAYDKLHPRVSKVANTPVPVPEDLGDFVARLIGNTRAPVQPVRPSPPRDVDGLLASIFGAPQPAKPSTPRDVNEILNKLFGDSEEETPRDMPPLETPRSEVPEYTEVLAPVIGLLASSFVAAPTKQDYLRVLTEITEILKNKQ